VRRPHPSDHWPHERHSWQFSAAVQSMIVSVSHFSSDFMLIYILQRIHSRILQFNLLLI
jgi:hypothetical protein